MVRNFLFLSFTLPHLSPKSGKKHCKLTRLRGWPHVMPMQDHLHHGGTLPGSCPCSLAHNPCGQTPYRTHVFQHVHAMARLPVASLQFPQHFLSSRRFSFSSEISERKVTEHSCSTVPLQSPWCAFHTVQRHKDTFISLVSDSHTKDTKDITHTFP